MVLNGDRLLHVVLADVLVHLLYGQWLPVLRSTTTARVYSGCVYVSLHAYSLSLPVVKNQL